MGFAEQKIRDIDDSARSNRRKLLNQDPSQKSGRLRNITQPASSAITTIGGTVSNVGHVVGKVSGILGATGIQQALEGGSTVKYHTTYGSKDSKGNEIPKDDRAERSGRRLKDFFQRIGSGNAPEIDTLNTFEMTIDFEPSVGSYVDLKGLGAGKQERSVVGTIFAENFSCNPRDSAAEDMGQLVFDMGIYVQRMTLPNITLSNGQTVRTMLGEFPVNGIYLSPDQHVFSIEVVNLRRSIGEDIFYRWMREVVSPFWTYGSQPYTTARITIDLTEHTNLRYVFLNCRPSNVMTVQPTQELTQNFTRQVQFAFDWMYVQSSSAKPRETGESTAKSLKVKSQEGFLDKISRIGNAANFSASNILKI